MARYQITIRTPNGKGWRIRTTSAAEFADIARELVDSASDKIKLIDLQLLWPEGSAARLHAFGAAVFDAVVKSVATQIRSGQLNVLKSGEGILAAVTDLLQSAEWKDSTCSDVGKRIVKILISLGLGYLRTQFPAISSVNADKALAVLDGLISRRS